MVNPWGVDEEQEVPILLCRGLRRPLPELWKLLGPGVGIAAYRRLGSIFTNHDRNRVRLT